MLAEQFQRNIMLIGEDNQRELNTKKVIVFGIGGVGGFVCESLARAGIGTLEIVDGDVIAASNINRQIIATHSSIGVAKVEAMYNRVKDINPEIECIPRFMFFTEKNAESFDFSQYDYVVDAIDDVRAKLSIIQMTKEAGTPIISSMGTGNKMDPTRFVISDISKTSVCPLAKVIRKELRKRGVSGVKVLYSEEEPCRAIGQRVPGSISFVPSVAGLIIGGQVIKDLIKKDD